MVRGHEVIEMAHGEQALGEGVGSAHVWLVCLVGRGALIVVARRQPRSEGGGYFSSLLRLLGKKVLYLEFDGVLHHGDIWRHPRRAALLWPKGR